MSANQSQERRAQNEVVFKKHNERVKRFVAKLVDDEMPINFTCECSDEMCHEKIQLSVGEYIRLRKNQDQYIVKKGHEQTDIEKVVAMHASFEVIEKT